MPSQPMGVSSAVGAFESVDFQKIQFKLWTYIIEELFHFLDVMSIFITVF